MPIHFDAPVQVAEPVMADDVQIDSIQIDIPIGNPMAGTVNYRLAILKKEQAKDAEGNPAVDGEGNPVYKYLTVNRKHIRKTFAEVAQSHPEIFNAIFAGHKTVAYDAAETEGLIPAGGTRE